MLGPVLANGRAAGGNDVAIPVSAFAEGHGDRESTWDAQPHDRRRVFATRASTSVPQENIQRDVSPAGDPRREAVQNRRKQAEDLSRERPPGFRCARRVCCPRHRMDLPCGWMRVRYYSII